MTKIHIDKIGAVTKNLDITHQEKLTRDLSCAMGTVLAVEILEDKSIYNELELPSGRMSKLKKGDIVVVALGNRMALAGFVGHLPETLKVDDVIHLLNFGGVAGVCTSANVQIFRWRFHGTAKQVDHIDCRTDPNQLQAGILALGSHSGRTLRLLLRPGQPRRWQRPPCLAEQSSCCSRDMG